MAFGGLQRFTLCMLQSRAMVPELSPSEESVGVGLVKRRMAQV